MPSCRLQRPAAMAVASVALLGGASIIGAPADGKLQPKRAVDFQEPFVGIREGERRDLVLTRLGAPASLNAGTVTLQSTPLDATSATDFTPISATLALAPGETRAVIPIDALPDEAVETKESFTVTIVAVTGDAAPGPTPTAIVTITDATPPPPPTGNGPAPTGDGAAPAGVTNGQAIGSPVPVDTAGVDRTPPVIRRLAVPRALRAGPGATVRFVLSEPGAVEARVRRATGRRILATRRAKAVAGPNRLRLRLPPAGRPRVGVHRLTLTAVDAAGNRSPTLTRTFRLVR